MSASCVSLEYDLLNEFVYEYLEVLDSWQRKVDNIRRMHHEVWKGCRLSNLIWQHRAGSRVEKQTRILPKGGQTDVDYMFEVIGISVESEENDKHLYFKSFSADKDSYNMCRTFGQIFAMEQYIVSIENDQKHGNIFRNSFQFDRSENAHMLIPNAFKTKVVSVSGLDYETEGKTTDNCPSIAGFGAMNEYDGVPCLRLANWPDVTSSWIERSNRSPLDTKWRSQAVLDIPLFVVPTGNPLSESRSKEFRLSFSMVEIACFERFNSQMRKLYGISKYVFKELFSRIELLSSYHVKTMMLWKVEKKENDYWDTVKPIDFMCEMISDLHSCVVLRELPHFFVNKCNIYPAHKHSQQKVDEYEAIAKNAFGFLHTVMNKLAIDDLGITRELNAKCFKTNAGEQQRKLELVDEHAPIIHTEITTKTDCSQIPKWTLQAKTELNTLKRRGPEAYIAGYLTRLLSVITFSIQENFEQNKCNGQESVEEISRLFVKYCNDKHISRLIPFVNSIIKRLSQGQCMNLKQSTGFVTYEDDFRSITAHEELEKIILTGNYSTISDDVTEGNTCQHEIGISITKFHQNLLPNDSVIQKLICILESENNGRCPRFYLDPDLFLRHLQIQKYMNTSKRDPSKVSDLLIPVCKIVGDLSVKVPYLGKLSYRHAGVYLLKAYIQVLSDLDVVVNSETILRLSNEMFEQRSLATNFDLR